MIECEGLRRLRSGDFNSMSQENQPDGSVIITLSKRGERKTYKFRVVDLYGVNEQVSDYQEIEQ